MVNNAFIVECVFVFAVLYFDLLLSYHAQLYNLLSTVKRFVTEVLKSALQIKVYFKLQANKYLV